MSVPRKGEASLSHLKSGLRFTPRPHPDTSAQLRMGRTESSHTASGRGRGMPHRAWKKGHRAGRALGQVGHPASWSGAGNQPDFLPRVHTGSSPPLRTTYYTGCCFNDGGADGKRLHLIYPPPKRCFQPASTWPLQPHAQLSPHGCEGARALSFLLGDFSC